MLARDSLSRAAAARRGAAMVAACVILGAAARLVALRALPVFGDEALNLRMAVLARSDPLARLWISLQEAQPPLHVWLLAFFLPASPDPVRAGRLLSAVAGVLCIPAAAWTARRTLALFGQPEEPARIASWSAAALVAFCPFFVFAERLARVDGLFLLETILAAGLSAALAGRVASGSRTPLGLASAFGALMGITMLTRQAVSYPLWLLPPAAWVLLQRERRRGAGRLVAAMAMGAVVAGALWLPMLLAPGEPDTFTRIFHSSDYRPAMTPSDRLRMTLANVRLAAHGFLVYLTPPVAVLAVLGILDLAAARRWRLLVYGMVWLAILLAPPAAFAARYFPRYALPAALPVCLLAGWGVARLWALVRQRVPAAVAAAGLAVAVLGPSAVDLVRGERNWLDWRLLPIDREQFVSGTAAGFASEQAAAALRRIAAERIVVLTPGISGNPTDAVWLLLGSDPRIRLSYTADALAEPLLPAAGVNGMRLLPGDSRDPRRRPEPLPEGVPVYALATDPLLTRSGWVGAVPFLARLNPGLTETARFENPQEPGLPANAVVVLRVR
ncbi:MAG TPA: hypothetical protein VGH97_11295 [Thermoanaerobaculia bacterium]